MHAQTLPAASHVRLVNPMLLAARSAICRDPVLSEVVALGRLRVVTEGTAVHRAGDLFGSVFFLTSGAAKRTLIREDGREQILGFPMPGDIIGMEAIDGGSHSTTVVALDVCAIIEIPFHAIEALAAENPAVARFLYHRMSAALRDEHGWMAALGLLNADERVAAFLLDLSLRFSARGFSPRRFMLRMTRAEIGSFLGLTLETVSRVFSRFQKLGLLNVTRRDIELLDMTALGTLAHSQSLH